MDRGVVLESIRDNVSDENLVKHMLATEAIMRTLARRLGSNLCQGDLGTNSIVLTGLPVFYKSLEISLDQFQNLNTGTI